MVEIKLFGIPCLILNGEKLRFPFVKIEGLLYYLADNGETTRDEAADIFWQEVSGETAKKNLRNAIYQANKQAGVKLIATNKNIIALNRDIEIKIDTKENSILDFYKGEFLQGFFIKYAERFEDWLSMRKRFYSEKYSLTLREKLSSEINLPKEEHEEQIKSLIAINEWEEKNHRLLLSYYKKRGDYSKAAAHYYNFRERLREELSVEPTNETTELFLSIIPEFPKKTEKLLGREKERALLTKAFIENYPNTVFLTGEFGSGKSFLAKNFARDVSNHLDVIFVRAYDSDFSVSMKAFNNLCGKLGIKEESGLEKLSQVLREKILNKKLLLIFDNLEKFDLKSLELFYALAMREKEVSFLFIHSLVKNKYISEFSAMLSKERNCANIFLDRFSREDMKGFLNGEMSDRVMELSKGNAFFMSALLSEGENGKKIADFIRLLLYPLSDRERDCLIYMSLFEEGADLLKLSSVVEYDAYSSVKGLIEKGLLVENDERFEVFHPMAKAGIEASILEMERVRRREKIAKSLFELRKEKTYYSEEIYQAIKLKKNYDELLIPAAREEEAESKLSFERVLELEKLMPNNPKIFILKGKHFMKQDKKEKALEEFQKAAISSMPPEERLSLLVDLVSVNLSLGNIKKSDELYKSAMPLALNLNNHRAVISLSKLYAKILRLSERFYEADILEESLENILKLTEEREV